MLNENPTWMGYEPPCPQSTGRHIERTDLTCGFPVIYPDDVVELLGITHEELWQYDQSNVLPRLDADHYYHRFHADKVLELGTRLLRRRIREREETAWIEYPPIERCVGDTK